MSSIQKIYPANMPLQLPDPYIFVMHHIDYYPKGNENMAPQTIDGAGEKWRMYYGNEVPGFPVHPHRGFETITIVEKGIVDHTDGLGSRGRYEAGDVQWLTSGKGIQHCEMFPLIHQDKENTMELFQIWFNLDSSHKWVDPSYKMLWKEDIPVVESKNKEGKITKVRVISGEYNQVKSLNPTPDSWANDRNHHVNIWLIQMEAGSEVILPKISSTLNRLLYIYEGEKISIEDKEIAVHYCAQLDGNQEITISNTGNKEARILFLDGEPMNESVVAKGPFVMNTELEIEQAFSDFRRTQFGGWPHESPGPVNNAETKRFALHADGRKEYPEG